MRRSSVPRSTTSSARLTRSILITTTRMQRTTPRQTGPARPTRRKSAPLPTGTAKRPVESSPFEARPVTRWRIGAAAHPPFQPHAATSRDDLLDHGARVADATRPVSYTHLRAHETRHDLVC